MSENTPSCTSPHRYGSPELSKPSCCCLKAWASGACPIHRQQPILVISISGATLNVDSANGKILGQTINYKAE